MLHLAPDAYYAQAALEVGAGRNGRGPQRHQPGSGLGWFLAVWLGGTLAFTACLVAVVQISG